MQLNSILKLLLSIGFSLFLLLILGLLYNNMMSKKGASDTTLDQNIYKESPQQVRKLEIQKQKKLNAHLPIFYLSIHPGIVPDSIFDIQPIKEREAMVELILQSGNPSFFGSKRAKILRLLPELNAGEARAVIQLLEQSEVDQWMLQYQELARIIPLEAQKDFKTEHVIKKTGIKYIPKLRWNGSQNQFHQFLLNIWRGNWGTSSVDGRPVFQKISEALPHTIWIALVSLFLSFTLGIALGTLWALYPETLITKASRIIAYFLTVIPLFWIASLMISFLTTSYGLSVFQLPSPIEFSSFQLSSYLLPIITIILASWGYIARQFEDRLSVELKAPYFKMALSRKIKKSTILWKYAFPNAIIPLLGLIGGSFSVLVSGSLVIEILYNIPGMGRLLFESIRYNDFYTILYILLLIGAITVLGRWLSDRLMEFLDPRIQIQAP